MQRKPVRHIQSPDLNQTKFTPRTRPAHQAMHSGQLKNADPNKKYVMCSQQEQHPMGYKYYESIGYSFEMAQKDGVTILLGEKAEIGKPLKWQGNYLMSCSKERAQEIFESGETGSTGQNYYDKLMSRIKQGMLEKRSNVGGVMEEWQVGELQQNSAPQVFREES